MDAAPERPMRGIATFPPSSPCTSFPIYDGGPGALPATTARSLRTGPPFAASGQYPQGYFTERIVEGWQEERYRV